MFHLAKTILSLLRLQIICLGVFFSTPVLSSDEEDESTLILEVEQAVLKEMTEGTAEDSDQALTKVMSVMLKSTNLARKKFSTEVILASTNYFAALAAQRGHLEIIKTIAKHDVHALNSQDEWGKRPAHFAAEAGHLDILRILTHYHSDALKAQDGNGATPIYYAAKQGHLLVLVFAQQHDPSSMEIADTFGRTALHAASMRGQLSVVKFLMHHFPQMHEVRDQWGEVPFATMCKPSKRGPGGLP